MFLPLNLDSKSWTTTPFLRMENITQIKTLHYAKIWEERRLFHDFINNCPGKNENLKPHGSLRVFSSTNIFSEAAPKIILEIRCSKISRNSVESTRGGFLFSLQGVDRLIYRNWITQFSRNYFSGYLWLITVPKRRQ